MDNQGKHLFDNIVTRMCDNYAGVHAGPMMSSPGLKYNNKVFAFYHNSSMGFRLGSKFDPESYGIKFAKPLSPFKTKPPLKGWFIIDHIEQSIWQELSELALEFTKTLK